MTTNYEKIKNMNIEEMARFLELITDDCCCLCHDLPHQCNDNCTGSLEEYLQQQSE